MNTTELINELIAAGAEPSEASELEKFEKSLNKPMFVRSDQLKLSNIQKVLARLNKSSGFSWRRFIKPLGLAIGGLSVVGASVFASQGSLPGDPLYSIKRLSETVFEQVNPKFKDEIPVRRSEEVKGLIENQKNDSEVKKSLEDYEEQSSKTKNEESIQQAEDNLRKAQERASEKSKAEIERILREGEVRGAQTKIEPEDKGKNPQNSEQKPDGGPNFSGGGNPHPGGQD